MVGFPRMLHLGADNGNGCQVALFLNQVQGFESLVLSFQGVLRVSTGSSSGISVVALRGRYNERGSSRFGASVDPPRALRNDLIVKLVRRTDRTAANPVRLNDSPKDAPPAASFEEPTSMYSTTVLQAEWTTERTTRKLLNQETGDTNAKRGNRTGVISFGPDPGFRGV